MLLLCKDRLKNFSFLIRLRWSLYCIKLSYVCAYETMTSMKIFSTNSPGNRATELVFVFFFTATESLVTSQGHVDDGLIGNSVSFCMDMLVQLQQ